MKPLASGGKRVTTSPSFAFLSFSVVAMLVVQTSNRRPVLKRNGTSLSTRFHHEFLHVLGVKDPHSSFSSHVTLFSPPLCTLPLPSGSCDSPSQALSPDGIVSF